jgi:hypothetical protein
MGPDQAVTVGPSEVVVLSNRKHQPDQRQSTARGAKQDARSRIAGTPSSPPAGRAPSLAARGRDGRPGVSRSHECRGGATGSCRSDSQTRKFRKRVSGRCAAQTRKARRAGGSSAGRSASGGADCARGETRCDDPRHRQLFSALCTRLNSGAACGASDPDSHRLRMASQSRGRGSPRAQRDLLPPTPSPPRRMRAELRARGRRCGRGASR